MTNWFDRLFSGKKSKVVASVTTSRKAQRVSVDGVGLRRRGNEFLDRGDLQGAIKCYQEAVAMDPNSVDAHTSLGYALKEVGNLEAAQSAFQKALALHPDSFDAAYLLGQTCNDLRQFEKTAEYFEQALALQPAFEPLYGELCHALFQVKAVGKAHDVIRNGIQRFPENAAFYLFQGNLYSFVKEWRDAVTSYTAAISLSPNLTPAHTNLASVFRAQGDLAAAIRSFNRAVAIEPDSAEVHSDLSAAYLALGRYGEAEEASRRALSLRPLYSGAQNNLGMALKALGKLLEAERCFRAALSIEPDSDVYLSNLGGTLFVQGRLSEAVASFRRAISINPQFIAAHSNLLYALSIDPEISMEQYLSEALTFGTSLAASAGMPFNNWLVNPDDASAAPLRVGLVSGRFCNNPVGYFLESVLSNIDSTKVQLVAYATSAQEDELTLRIRPYFAQWENILGMETAQSAEKIRADRIHILVDLNGHTEGNSLPLFALKPAPVQTSWLGYWATTGVPEMDFILADETSLPAGDQAWFTETVHYLPETRLCFTAPAFEVPIGPLPALGNGFVTFGSFQTLSKINDQVLSLWAQILQSVPHSRLRLAVNQLNDGAFQQRFLKRLREADIDEARVTLVGPMAREKYLASYNQVDLVLDTFPYAGGTTTCEALWMGVPTLTLKGGTMIARQGAAMLTCLGLKDWIAFDEADYLAMAISNAADLDGLVSLRRNLRERALASPLFDAPRFARNLENAFRAMWQQKYLLASEWPRHEDSSATGRPTAS